MIWPECWTHYIDTLETGDAQTAIWWLSVDNNNSRFTANHFKERSDILHLYQSEYARQYLLKHKVADHQVIKMTEFIPQERCFPSLTEEKRDLDVLYNPAKGIHYTDEIQKRSGGKKGGICFTAIGGGLNGQERISPQE
eukprot:1947627-Ditylum_brightwellii.AAC.1